MVKFWVVLGVFRGAQGLLDLGLVVFLRAKSWFESVLWQLCGPS